MTSGDLHVLEDALAAQMLLDASDRRYLVPFLGEERSVGQVAALLGETVERTAYRVRRLASRGLLTVVRNEPRKGRAVTIYCAAAEIRAPLAQLPMSDITRLFEAVDAEGRNAFLSALSNLAVGAGVFDWALRLHRADDGTQRFELTSSATKDGALQNDRTPAIVFNWVPALLDDESAKQLQRDIIALVDNLPISDSAPTHLAGFFLTPLRP